MHAHTTPRGTLRLGLRDSSPSAVAASNPMNAVITNTDDWKMPR